MLTTTTYWNKWAHRSGTKVGAKMEQKNQQVIYRRFPSHTNRKCQLQSDYLAQAIRRLSKAPTVYLPTHMPCNYTCTSFPHIKCAYMCAYQTACAYTAHQYMHYVSIYYACICTVYLNMCFILHRHMTSMNYITTHVLCTWAQKPFHWT